MSETRISREITRDPPRASESTDAGRATAECTTLRAETDLGPRSSSVGVPQFPNFLELFETSEQLALIGGATSQVPVEDVVGRYSRRVAAMVCRVGAFLKFLFADVSVYLYVDRFEYLRTCGIAVGL